MTGFLNEAGVLCDFNGNAITDSPTEAEADAFTAQFAALLADPDRKAQLVAMMEAVTSGVKAAVAIGAEVDKEDE